MTLAAKLFISAVLALGLGVGGTTGLFAAHVYSAGSISVLVEDRDGSRVNVRVPAFLAHMATSLVPDDVLDEALHDVRGDVEPYLPMVRDLGSQFADAPDFEVVRVESGDETILIEKRNGHLWVRVESPNERVQVKVPVKTIRAVTQLFDRA